jgi:hypothetical protein
MRLSRRLLYREARNQESVEDFDVAARASAFWSTAHIEAPIATT